MNTLEIVQTLVKKQDLTKKDIAYFIEGVVQEKVPFVQIAAILVALTIKGEATEEISGLIQEIRKHMVQVNVRSAIDVCGTGGDAKNTFNISTAVAFVVAGCGVPVAKHGNRGASSKSGSADVVEALGVNMYLSPHQAEDVLKKVGMVFLFAPLFHPSFKNVSLVRKELGIPTIFNYLGPFLSPAQTTKQLIGVPNEEIAQKLITVSKQLGYKHLCIVVSEDGMDEISVSLKTTVFENKNGKVSTFVINPTEYGFKYSKTNIPGGTPEENAHIIEDILKGKKGQKRDIVVLNSAVALYVSGAVTNIKEGIGLAEKSIDSGNAKTVLENLRKETQTYA